MDFESLQVGDELRFVQYNFEDKKFKSSEQNKEKLEIKVARVVDIKKDKIFYKVDCEDSTRILVGSALNIMRDFGSSIVGIFNDGQEEEDYINMIIEKLEQRVLEIYRVKSDLILEIGKRVRDEKK